MTASPSVREGEAGTFKKIKGKVFGK